MATKTFKIGLSNTDKQNMAQEVYERLLALTFPEYDTGTSYEVGDFVVYNDQLYKCIGDTTGAWDSTKWELATLNDLLTDIEDAVAFVNDKANVDGNYPTMTVGVADQLSPYDDESGDDQDEPFSFQVTGTGNGTQPDFATGNIALMKEKRGNTVVVNQLTNYLVWADFGVGDADNCSITKNNDGSFTLTVSATVTTASGVIGIENITPAKGAVSGHKYLIIGSPNQYIPLGYGGNWVDNGNGGIATITFGSSITLTYKIDAGLQAGTYKIYPKIIDLTKWFNGDIPQDLLDHQSNFFRYYQGSLAYNAGELVNANGRYIKCIGMNQWDEEWEVGNWSITDGQAGALTDRIRCKNFIRVIPNQDYYFKFPVGARILCYDTDKNYLGQIDVDATWSNTVKKTPANCSFIKFNLVNTGGTTYNHDISINLYYEDEARCLTYEPYEVLTNNDTGTEVLRSAGNAHDVKLPSGEIKRNVGYVDLGSLSYTYNSTFTNPNFSAPLPSDVAINDSGVSNAIASIYKTTSANDSYTTMDNMTIKLKTVSGEKRIYICNSTYTDATAFKNAMSGVYLFYELDEPTTEQGTPYSENLVIDDFGSMDFQGTNGVPQGNLIFYPVDYKAFIDTLYNYTDGTPSELALKSDLASDKTELQGVDSQLQNAIGGTLRQCLCVKESLDFEDTTFVDMSELNWTYSGSSQCFTTVISDKVSGSLKLLSTLYKTENDAGFGVSNMCISGSTSTGYLTTLFLKNINYTGGANLKNAMKGVLLAYEKASS